MTHLKILQCLKLKSEEENLLKNQLLVENKNLAKVETNKIFKNKLIKKLRIALDFKYPKILCFVDEMCKSQSWFVPSLTRKQSEEYLEREPAGSFVIRLGREKDYLALSLKSGDYEFVHHKIVHTPAGWTVSGCQKSFLSLSSMVLHHSILREGLPATLRRNTS